MKAIVWGADGQDGYYLSALLEEKGVEVIKIGKPGSSSGIDITRYAEVCAVIEKYKPDYIFNFAANSTTRHSAWKENHETICTGSLHVLEAAKTLSPDTRIFLSGSGLQFRNTGDPISEHTQFDASSMYAASRTYTTYMARYYRQLGVKVYMGFFFNHDSPRRSERHINKKIIDVAKRIAAGSHEKLLIGDGTVKKEFGFAGDIVKAVWTLVQQDAITEAVIGTGKAYSINEWLHICFSAFGLHWQEHVENTTGFVPEYKILVSDPSSMFSLGWSPEVDIEGLANLMIA